MPQRRSASYPDSPPVRPARRPSTAYAIDDAIPSYRRHLRAGGRTDATVDRTCIPHLEKSDGFLVDLGMPRDVRAIRREHIEAYIEHLATEGICRKGRVGLRPASLSLAYRSIRPFWKWLVEEDEIERSPMERMKPPILPIEAPPVIREEQMVALLKACEGTGFEERREVAASPSAPARDPVMIDAPNVWTQPTRGRSRTASTTRSEVPVELGLM